MNRRVGAMIGNMISRADIEKLASLARIKMEEEEKDQFREEIDSILSYVEQVKKASISLDAKPKAGDVKNVLREDDNSHEAGMYSEKILEEAPEREGNFFKVKKIL